MHVCLLKVCMVCSKFTLSLHIYQLGDFPRKKPSGTLPDFDIEVMDFDIEAWTPIYVYPYIGVPKLRYWSTLFWLWYRARYWTAISKSIDFDIEVSYFTKLRYWSVETSISKHFDIENTSISKQTAISKQSYIEGCLISKLKSIYGYWSHVLQYWSVCDI